MLGVISIQDTHCMDQIGYKSYVIISDTHETGEAARDIKLLSRHRWHSNTYGPYETSRKVLDQFTCV